MSIGTGRRAARATAAARPSSRPAAPRDRFDDVPDDLGRVGAHRAPVRRRPWVTFAWAALATGALVVVGVLGLSAIEGRVAGADTGPATSTEAAGPAATVDPDATVVLLNGTKTSGLAAAASRLATADDWKVGSTANADSQSVKESTVYYGEDGQRGAAKGLAKSLGISRTVKSDRFEAAGSSRLTVVLGSDFSAG